jgi:hypothetical protein
MYFETDKQTDTLTRTLYVAFVPIDNESYRIYNDVRFLGCKK